MIIRINKKGNKIQLKADEGEHLRIAPQHLPFFNRQTYELQCDEFELTVETYKTKKK